MEDQYQLGMRGLAAQVANLRAAVAVLAERCALRPGQAAPSGAEHLREARSRPQRGYRSAGERFAKTRRLAVLRERLASAEAALAAGRPSMVVGGKRLWCTRNHLGPARLSEQQWRDRWDAARMFVTAVGESGKAGGNETIRVDETGRLGIKIPAALVGQLGSHVVIEQPVRFCHRDPDRGRWYLDASWKISPEPAPELDELRAGRVLGVDLNADHLAGWVVDSSGNPVGDPTTIEVSTAGLPASQRDGRVRAAITTLLDHAQHAGCGALVVENLDFADARATGRENLGRGARGKRLRRAVAGIPTRRFRTRLTAMAARHGITVIGVDAAYTSRWGAQHWRKPLQQQTSEPVTRHHAAAAAIGRRGLGLAVRRRPAEPRTGQRTAACTPPTRPDHRPNHGGRHGSSGPPTHPL